MLKSVFVFAASSCVHIYHSLGLELHIDKTNKFLGIFYKKKIENFVFSLFNIIFLCFHENSFHDLKDYLMMKLTLG
jgi:hypothetical protein